MKARWKNLAMTWIDYKKAYDIVPQSWIINCHKMYKILQKLHRKNHEKLEGWINCKRKKLGWNKDPKRYFPRRCTITHTIHTVNVYIISFVSIINMGIIVGVSQWFRRLGFNPRSNHTKVSEMVLDASLFNTQHYKVHINGKWINTRKGVMPFPTPWCSSYWKGTFRLPPTMVGQFTTTYIYPFLWVLIFFLSLFNSTICLSIFLYLCKCWSQIILNQGFCNFSELIWPNKETNWKIPSLCLIEWWFEMIKDSTTFWYFLSCINKLF